MFPTPNRHDNRRNSQQCLGQQSKHARGCTCLCVNAATSTGVSIGTSLGTTGGTAGTALTVEVTSSSGVTFTGLTAIELANALEFPSLNSDLVSQLGLNINPNGNCAATPTCTGTQILCNGQCYDGTQYACKSGLPTMTATSGAQRRAICPTNQSRCPVIGSVAGGKRGLMWECIDFENDVESCELTSPINCQRLNHADEFILGGGCVEPESSFAPVGEDCTAIPNTERIGCIEGRCSIFTCRKGWKLVGSGWNASCQAPPRSETRYRKAGSPFLLNFQSAK